MSGPLREPSPPHPKPDAGFSLLEMMVALALLAGMLALLPGTLRLAARAWQAQDGLDRAASIATARAMLAERLASAMPVAASVPGDAAAGQSVAFAGEPQSLSFVAPAPQSAAGSGLLTYTLQLDGAAAHGRRRNLAIDTAPYAGALQSASVVPAAAARHVLLEDVGSLTLRYFGVPADGATPPTWHARWSGRARLPELIEVSFDIAAANGRRTERVVVETRLGVTR